jgi:hypothetical protein
MAAPLVSIQLPSNRPDQFDALLENLEATLSDPGAAEVVVKIDTGDAPMLACVRRAEATRRVRVKTYVAPGRGHFELWRDQNALIPLADPGAHFLQNINDEVRYLTPGWDRVLARYIGRFPDDVFRLRCSAHRRWRYDDLLDIGPHPENTAFITRKWFDVSGDWCAAHSPDSFQQGVACRLERMGERRDVVIDDIRLGGLGAGRLMDEAALARKMEGVWRAWDRLYGLEIQEEMSRRAARLAAYIRARREGAEPPSLVEDASRRTVNGIPYAVSRREIRRMLYRHRIGIWRRTGEWSWRLRAFAAPIGLG